MPALASSILHDLNTGTREARHLQECLAVDFQQLMAAVFPVLATEVKTVINPADGITKRMAAAGLLLHRSLIFRDFSTLLYHSSDTVRGWAAYYVAAMLDLSLEQRLQYIRPLADDRHFGVREWAWLALRPFVIAAPDTSFSLLTPWVHEESANLRRFAVEITRPRGVWCSHLSFLKDNPAPGLVLLEPLKADTARYVQDSVANWLNDASKSCPAWTANVCERWHHESSSAATGYICRRALRTIGKKLTVISPLPSLPLQ
jgi:3-methyladenine DNA glycosylase AlkC